MSYVKRGGPLRLRLLRRPWGLGPQSRPGKSGPRQESCECAHLSHPPAPALPASYALSLGLDLWAQIQALTGCRGFPLSSKANLAGFWQLDAPDSTSRGWGG